MRKHPPCPRRRQISTSTDLQYHAMENSIYHDHRCPDVKLHATRLQPRFRLPSFLFIKSLWGLPFLSKINYFDGPHIEFMQWSRCAYRARMLLRYLAILIWNINSYEPTRHYSGATELNTTGRRAEILARWTVFTKAAIEHRRMELALCN